MSNKNETKNKIQNEEQARKALTDSESGIKNASLINFEFESEGNFGYYVKLEDGYESVYMVDKKWGSAINVSSEISRPILKAHAEIHEHKLADKYQALSSNIEIPESILAMLDEIEKRLNFEIAHINEHPNKLALTMNPVNPGREDCPIYIHRHTKNNLGLRIEHSQIVTYPETDEFRNSIGCFHKDRGNNLFYEVGCEQLDAWMEWLETYYAKTKAQCLEEHQVQKAKEEKVEAKKKKERDKKNVIERTAILEKLGDKVQVPNDDSFKEIFVGEGKLMGSHTVGHDTIHLRYACFKFFDEDVIVYANIRLTSFCSIQADFRIQVCGSDRYVDDYHFNKLVESADVFHLIEDKESLKEMSNDDWLIEKLSRLIDYVNNIFDNEENLFSKVKVC